MTAAVTTPKRYVELEEIEQVTTLSPSTWKALVRKGEAPKPRQLSANRSAWLMREIDEWCESRPISNLPPPPNCGRRKEATT